MQEHQPPERTGQSDHLPDDIALGEAGRNWVNRRHASDPQREVRRLAADASVRADIASVYGTDW